jgi:hypothetical protein
VASIVAASLAAAPVAAQQRDSARAGVAAPAPAPQPQDTGGPPVSPKRAFLSSLLVPGLGQAALDRGHTGALFVFVEALSLSMLQKSLADLREAKRLEGDSLAFGYTTQRGNATITDPLSGQPFTVQCREGNAPGFRPVSSQPRTSPTVGIDTVFAIVCPTRWTTRLVEARRTHVEDWVALLIFNHLISGADAFVAAHLWDLPGRVRVSSARRDLPRDERAPAFRPPVAISLEVSW